MATSAWSSALRSAPGYAPRPATTTAVPVNFPALPSLPQVPAIDEARAPNAATRAWLLQQLGPLAQQNQAALTNIRAGTQLRLAGLGGWHFGTDDPNTAQREDLQLAFDPKSGLGEREKQAVRGEVNQGNAQGLLYSSFTNQNMGSALQRLSLEGQQIANQYASQLNQQHTGYAGQVSEVIGQWTGLYGQDAAWLIENPPTPPPPPNPAAGGLLQGTNPRVDPRAWPAGYQQVWIGKGQPNRTTMNRQYGNNWGTVDVGNGQIVVMARVA